MNKGLVNLPYLQKLGRQINRRLLDVERVSHNSGMSGDSIQRVVQPTVNEDGQKAPGLKFGQPRVMALFLALTLFQHLIDGFHNRGLRQHVADLLGVDETGYTASQMNLRFAPPTAQGADLPSPTVEPLFRHTLRLEDGATVRTARCSCLSARHGHVHRRGCGLAVPTALGSGPRRRTVRQTHLPSVPGSKAAPPDRPEETQHFR